MTSAFAGLAIVPVLTAPSVETAIIAGRALERAGITCVEMTLRTEAGLDAIAALHAETGLLVGAGTVIRPAQVKAVAAAGARFIVSPGLDEAVLDATLAAGLDPLPGAATATEVQRALSLGVTTVKFFPADRLGGLDTIAALAAPFNDVQFIPSGGVSDDNLATYLAHPAVPAVSGSWVVPSAAVAAADGTTIERVAVAAVAALDRDGVPRPRAYRP